MEQSLEKLEDYEAALPSMSVFLIHKHKDGKLEGAQLELATRLLALLASTPPPGQRVQLVAKQKTWEMGTPPILHASVAMDKDAADDVFLATHVGLGCRVGIDGGWYTHPPVDLTGVAYHSIRKTNMELKVQLDERWVSMDDGAALSLGKGHHRVLFAWAGYTGSEPEKRPVLLVSNEVEIVIRGKDDAGEEAEANQDGRPTDAAHRAFKEALSKDRSFGAGEGVAQPAVFSEPASVGGVAVVSLEQQERVFYEGDVVVGEKVPVRLAPLKLLPGVEVSVDWIRFYAKDKKLRAEVGFLADALPDGWCVLARLELRGKDGVSCYDRESIQVPPWVAPADDTGGPVRHTVDRQCYELQLAEEVIRRFRISLHAVHVSSTDGEAEGTMALGVYIPVSVKGNLPGLPDAVRCGSLRFKKTGDDGFRAELGTMLTAKHDSKWVADVEVMDEEGKPLAHARRVFATTRYGWAETGEVGGVGGNLWLSLGRWTKTKKAIRFRVALRSAPDDEVESLEAPFEIGTYTLLWLVASTHEVPHLVMVRGVHFEKLDNGQVQATLRAGGKPLADTEWQIRLELLDADGRALQSVETTLSTTKEHEFRPFGGSEYPPNETDIPLGLGNWDDVSATTRFRVSLWRGDT